MQNPTNITFLKSIRTSYGLDCAEKLKTLSKAYCKLAKQKNRRIFLLRCKHMNVQPMFLNFKVSHIKFTGTYLENKFNNIINNTKNKILNLTITESTKTINNINRQIDQIESELQLLLPGDVFANFIKYEQTKYEKTFNSIKTKNQKKISNLILNEPKSQNNINVSDWLNNISNKTIPNEIAEVLALGNKFSLPINHEKNLPITEYIACIESAIHEKPNEIKDTIRSDVVNIITNHKIKLRHNRKKQNSFQNKIQKQFIKTKKFLKDNPDITILKPDKSNKTVVMNTTDYNNKMDDLLNDSTTYKKIRNDPTNIYQTKNNTFIKKIISKKQLSDIEAKNLMIHNAVAPKIYGLPKLHKPNIPLRPIVSSIQSPFYKLSKYLSQCLTKITYKNEYYIKDSFCFKEFITKIKIPKHFKLVSLDVTSLYTNIPIELITIIIKKKWDLLKNHTTLSQEIFIEAINLTLNNNYFQYKDIFYQQLNGCAMGSPISSTVAQLVMEYLEESVITNLNIPILFFKRYVDDCITAIPEDQISNVLTAFNSFHQKLQFTSEIEHENKINFLDLTIIKNQDNEELKTKWFTKDTWSGRYLNYNSHHSTAQKNSVIIGLTDRALALTSAEFRPQTLKKVRKTLKENNFPTKQINKIIKQRTFKFYNKAIVNKTSDLNNTPKKYIAMPYTHELSEKIKYILKKYDIIVCHKTQNMLSSLFTPLKSKVNKKKKSNVIYSIPCLNCPKKYIGMTTQYLENRLNGHKYTKNASTALHKHEKNEKHEFHFNNTKILTQDSNYQKLLIKEMIEIKKDNHVVNDKQDINNLSQIYHNLIH